MNGFAKQSVRIGEWLLKLWQLQLFWVLYTLKGGVVLGLFPATGTVFKIVYQWLSEPASDRSIKEVFGTFYRQNMKVLNKLGYGLTAALGVVLLDLQISKQFIHVYLLHYFLVALFILVLGTALYVFPIFARYELSTVNYLKQAFFFFFTNIIETIAMLLGFLLVVIVVTFLPILAVVAGMPLFCLPVSWFAYQAMKKVELRKLV